MTTHCRVTTLEIIEFVFFFFFLLPLYIRLGRLVIFNGGDRVSYKIIPKRRKVKYKSKANWRAVQNGFYNGTVVLVIFGARASVA